MPSPQAEAFVNGLIATRKRPRKQDGATITRLPPPALPPPEDKIEVIGVGTFTADEYAAEAARGGAVLAPVVLATRPEIIATFGNRKDGVLLVSRVDGHETFRHVSRKSLDDMLPILRELADVHDWTIGADGPAQSPE